MITPFFFVLTCVVDQNESQKDLIHDRKLKFFDDSNETPRSVKVIVQEVANYSYLTQLSLQEGKQ